MPEPLGYPEEDDDEELSVLSYYRLREELRNFGLSGHIVYDVDDPVQADWARHADMMDDKWIRNPSEY
jgi:hypothetical protein